MARPVLKNVIGKRSWAQIKSAWIDSGGPLFGGDATARTGLEDLAELQHIATAKTRDIFGDSDVPALRGILFSEGVFLFHKCAHSHLAAQRLGVRGMHSWSMFSAYHSAYLGAKGLMALLGIGMPVLNAGQFLVDLFPAPKGKSDVRMWRRGEWVFSTFNLVGFGAQLNHEEVWSAFSRSLRVTSSLPGSAVGVYAELESLARVSKPRNELLYTPNGWPAEDLLNDALVEEFVDLFARGLGSSEERGFLLRLSYAVYHVFEALMADLGEVSGRVRRELEMSRVRVDPRCDDLVGYNCFIDTGGKGREDGSVGRGI